MSFETALRARLKAAPALSSVEVEWAKRLGYPSVRLAIVSLPLDRHMGGFTPWQAARVQIDVFALDAPTKAALRDAVLTTIAPAASIGGFRFGRVQDVVLRDLSEQDETDFIHRDAIEAVMPHMRES